MFLIDPAILIPLTYAGSDDLEAYSARLAELEAEIRTSEFSAVLSSACAAALYQDGVMISSRELVDVLVANDAEHISPDAVLRSRQAVLSLTFDLDTLTGVQSSIYEAKFEPSEIVTRLPVHTGQAFRDDLFCVAIAQCTGNDLPCSVVTADDCDSISVNVDGKASYVEFTDGSLVNEELTIVANFPLLFPSPGLPQFQKVIDVVNYAVQEFQSEIIFLDSALDSATNSPYQHFDRLLDALKSISTVAKQLKSVKSSTGTLGKGLEQCFAELGIDYAAHESGQTKGKYKSEYTIEYGGKTVWIEQHIKLGVDRDQRNCLRIYFLYDAGKDLFVVAHVGEHKPNKSS